MQLFSCEFLFTIKSRRCLLRSSVKASNSFKIQKMKKPKFEFFCIVAFVLVALSSCDETYDVKYDSVDVDEILKSERLLTNYINCLMDEGPCTEDGRDLKEILPDAITTDCSKCTEKQKDGSARIMHYM